MVYADVRIRPVTGYASAHGLTDSLGQINGPVPASMNLVLEVMSPCNTVMYSKNIGPFSSDVNLGSITVDNNPSIITVQGRLINCSGTPVINGFAVISYNNELRYASVENANGEFTTTFYNCAGMPPTCEIFGVDASAQQQGAMINVSVISPVMNAGNITACGTSALQYVNYNLDGDNQSYSSLVAGDQFSATSFDSTGNSKSANISVTNSNNQDMFFQFSDNGTGSIYELSYLTFKNSGLTTLIQPFNVIVTHYPSSAGEFFEGSFSGQYKDVLKVTHTISCSFRVRRI